VPLTPAKMLRYGAVGFEFSSPMIAGAVAGHYLDKYFGTDPKLTLIMFLLGVLAGFVRLIMTLRELQKSSEVS
jgi:F0F1-type ATP synthase assembly protein I